MLRFRRPAQSWENVLVFSIFAMAALLVFVVAGRWFGEPESTKQPAGKPVEFPDLFCRYVKPGAPWERETASVQRSLKALLVMHRTAPEAWLALLAKDFKDQPLSDTDLRAEAMRRLGDYFHPESLEWKPAEDTMLAERRALRFGFRAEADTTLMSGECACLAHEGIAYWFVVWAPANQVTAAEEEFAELRQRFRLLPAPARPAAKRPTVRTFRGHEFAYNLQDHEGRWQEWKPATDYDADADLVLTAQERVPTLKSEDRKMAVAAWVAVLVLKPSPATLEEAVQRAQAHVAEAQKVAYPDTTVETVADSASAAPLPPFPVEGEPKGRLVRLHVRNGENRQLFVLLGVLRLPERLVVVQAESAWQERATWEPRFTELLRSLRVPQSSASAESDQGNVPGR